MEVQTAALAHRAQSIRIWAGRIGGPLLAVVIYSLTASSGLSPAGRYVAAIGALIAALWMTEALPLPVTSLLPLILFPLTGVLNFADAAAPYADQYIFLFLGGFMLATAIERWNLHRRIALLVILGVGTQPRRLVAGFMLATALISMWISNTATAMLMLPIALSVVTFFQEHAAAQRDADSPHDAQGAENFAVCVFLGVAYSASIGGMATLVGTPPNALLAGFLADRGMVVGFGQWMMIGVPVAAVLLVITWTWLVDVSFPPRLGKTTGSRDLIAAELRKLGPISRGEWTVLAVFAVTALAWIVREPLTHWIWLVDRAPAVARVNDAMIALAGAMALFAIPIDLGRNVFALDWEAAKKLPWGVLLLFGGGLSLATAAMESGFADWVGALVGSLAGMPTMPLLMGIAFVVVFLSEVTSNTALAAAFLPLMYAAASGLGIDPILVLVTTTLAASGAFMLPAGTPPNAIVFGTGQIKIGQMMRVGLGLNLLVALLVPWMLVVLVPWALGQ